MAPTESTAETPEPDGAALVTGATGTVGSVVAAELTERDEPVKAATRDPEGADLAAGTTPTEFDFDRPETWGPALSGVDRLFVVRPPTATRVGQSLLPFLDAAERTGVEHAVVLSVLGAERNPLLPHRRVERHVERSGMAHTHLRASFFMQNFAEVHLADVRDGRIVVPAGDGETSFVDARDVGAVGAAALAEPGHRGRAYDLTGPEALDYRAAAAVFAAVLGVVFVAIAVGFSAAAATQRQALIGGVGIYVLFVLLWGAVTGQFLGAASGLIDPLPATQRQVSVFLQVANPTTGVELLSNSFLRNQLLSGEAVNQQISAVSMLVFWTIAPPLVGLWKFDTDDL